VTRASWLLALAAWSCGDTASDTTPTPRTDDSRADPPEPVQLWTGGPEYTAPLDRAQARFVSDCQERQNAARALVASQIMGQAQCQEDADCQAFDTSDLQTCWPQSCGSLPDVGSASYAAAQRAAITSDAVQAACSEWRARDCHPIEPSCPLLGKFVGYRCVEQRCAEVYEGFE